MLFSIIIRGDDILEEGKWAGGDNGLSGEKALARTGQENPKFSAGYFVGIDKWILKFIWRVGDPEEPAQFFFKILRESACAHELGGGRENLKQTPY